ncbi:MAG: DNA polymerase III subunit delta [Bacillota bacterium]|jgi:DNA polymerase-3 subunit delta|nr:DNA polymerase III subunit delta [Candidatus Fermentithermobacillaceae bacterium]
MKPTDASTLIASGDLGSLERTAAGYLIVGEEVYWHRKIIEHLSKLYPNGAENLSGEETTWEVLKDNLVQPSFFGPSLWVVRDAQALLGNKEVPAIDRVSPGNCLVLSCPVKENPAQKAFLEAWDRLGGVVVNAATPSFGDAVRWVESLLKSEQLKISREAAELLVNIAGRSMDRLEQEVTKIVLYMGPAAGVPSLRPRSVGPQIVLACASQDPEKTAFGFVDAVAQKNTAKANSEFQDLQSRSSSAILAISLLASHFALMWRAKEAVQKGVSQAALPKALGVHPYLAKKALLQSRSWSFRELEKAVRLLLAVDEGLKTGAMDAERAIDYLLAGICKG